MRLPADLRLRLQRVRPLAEVGLVCALLGLLPFSTCASQHLLGVPCPGCGFTRALVALARGDLGATRLSDGEDTRHGDCRSNSDDQS